MNRCYKRLLIHLLFLCSLTGVLPAPGGPAAANPLGRSVLSAP